MNWNCARLRLLAPAAITAMFCSAAPQDPIPSEDPVTKNRCCVPPSFGDPAFGAGCPSGCFPNASFCWSTGVAPTVSGVTCIEGEGDCLDMYDSIYLFNVPLYDCAASPSQSCITGRPNAPYTCYWVQNGTGTITYDPDFLVCHEVTSTLCTTGN